MKLSLSMIALASLALAEVASAQNAQTASVQKREKALLEACQSESSKETESDCQSDDAKDVERITVLGYKLNPINTGSEGSYTIDKKIIDDYRFGNGNLNDILAILPGVQYSDQTRAEDQLTSIVPDEVSISGAQGHHSGYNIDGISNNSRLSTGNAQVDENLRQDINTHSQASFINLSLVDTIEVYDSNIPAKYGQFSGGLVNVTTKKPSIEPSFGIGYRTTGDGFSKQIHVVGPENEASSRLYRPSFDKIEADIYYSGPITDHSGIVLQAQFLESTEYLDQLGQIKAQQQKNTNVLVKYHHDFTLNDSLTVTALYAPFNGDYFEKFQRNSDYSTSGGGISTSIAYGHDGRWGTVNSQVSYSDNRYEKRAPNYWLAWRNIRGRSWADYYGGASSIEGGFGDIDKNERRISADIDTVLAPWQWLSAEIELTAGLNFQHQIQEFNRLTDNVIYNGVVTNSNIDCGAYTIDCVETELNLSLAELEQQLGRPIDLTNASDILLYQNNVVTAGQYFQNRQVAKAKDTSVAVNYLAFYSELSVDWRNHQATLGGRYEYNDFFKEHNIAPRFRWRWDLFADQQHLISFGANRYYQANLTQYKLNQSITPAFNEYRRSFGNQLQNWVVARTGQGHLYLFTDTETPYADELSLDYQYQLFGGTLQLKWLSRQSKKQITRTEGFNEIGQAVLYGTNRGANDYHRYTLAWMANYESFHVQFNISKASNKVDKATFDGEFVNDGQSFAGTSNFHDQELVILRQVVEERFEGTDQVRLKTAESLITEHDLGYQRTDFNRPVIANLSFGTDWHNWQLASHFRYSASQDAIYATGETDSVTVETNVCEGCVITRKDFPVYRKYRRASYWLADASIKYHVPMFGFGSLTLSADFKNVFNRRTYQIGPLATGTELGRSFWLGIRYQH